MGVKSYNTPVKKRRLSEQHFLADYTAQWPSIVQSSLSLSQRTSIIRWSTGAKKCNHHTCGSTMRCGLIALSFNTLLFTINYYNYVA